ncbi:hypothetical protein [Micromonospora echinofusca]|uniref:Uncharacterized protein n=1 Tax=Micromonospora echinofusca TaxID=47858 RepID=A0ABS3VVN2_MICEH|nr:hypothetical protein [Micromonospora echinofusca]MBO4208458.1 hypothetical protein [Micromonospora echinofusca]
MSFSIQVPQSGTNPEHQYPVVGFTSLDPVRRRFLRPRRRFAEEFPEQRPGSVLVFQANGTYALAPPGPDMLRSHTVVDALAVAVVSVRQELVVAHVPLPTSATGRVLLSVTFHCRVVDPILVLEAGAWDIRPSLTAHLLNDDILQMLGTRDDVMSNPDVPRRILSRIYARKDLEPSDVPGMTMDLVSVQVGIQAGRVDHGYAGDTTFDTDPNDPQGRYDDDYGSPGGFHAG